MNRESTELTANTPRITGQSLAAERTRLIWIAWLATLLLSKLPLVIARDLLGSDIPWIVPAWIGLAFLLFALTYVWQALKPLRSYFSIMGVILLVTAGIDPLLRGTAFWQAIFAGRSLMIITLGERILIALQALVVIGVLMLMGWSRREAFLVMGDLKAPLGGQAAARKKRTITWSALGLFFSLVLGGLFFAFLASQNPGSLYNLGSAIPWLPVILLSAMLNAFGEEAMYRAAPLATLISPVGAGQGLWMTAVWFGLGHYYGGIPSGPVGFFYTGLLALLLGKAMLDTRGMGWSWIIHVVLDTVIYTMLALTVVAKTG